MTSMISKATLLGGVTAIALAGLAFAAPAAAPADPAKGEKRIVIVRGGPGGPDGPGRGGPRFHRADPEQHARRLRDILQLTPAQEPALQAYITATRPEMRFERRERPAPDAGKPEGPPPPRPTLTTPERLDRQAERMAKHQADFARRSAAIKTFYAQLTAPQKKAFDALGVGGPGGRGGPHGGDIRVIRRSGGDAPLAFGPEDGDVMFGALDDFDIEFDPADMPPPPEPPETPGA